MEKAGLQPVPIRKAWQEGMARQPGPRDEHAGVACMMSRGMGHEGCQLVGKLVETGNLAELLRAPCSS